MFDLNFHAWGIRTQRILKCNHINSTILKQTKESVLIELTAHEAAGLARGLQQKMEKRQLFNA